MIRLKNTLTQWLLLIQNICYNKKKFITSIGCHEHLPEVVREVFLEINLNQKTLIF